MWWYQGDGSWGAWLLVTLAMVTFWGLAFWAVATAVRTGARGAAAREDTPEQILAERFARGEIDEDDYRRRLEALRGEQAVGRAGSGATR